MRSMSKAMLIIWVSALVFVQSAAFAQDRDAVYQKALSLSQDLAETNPSSMPAVDYRRMAVQVAGALKALSFQEAALRSRDKAAPPSSAALRPGQVEPEALDGQAPGKPVSLARVPDEWFYSYLAKAKDSMAQLMGVLDTQSGTAEDVTVLADEIRRQVALMNRPPHVPAD